MTRDEHYRRLYEQVVSNVEQTGNRQSARYAGRLLCLLLAPQLEMEHSLDLEGVSRIRGREYPPAMRTSCGRPMWQIVPHLDVQPQGDSFRVTVWIRVENLCNYETVTTQDEGAAVDAARACARHCGGSAWLGGPRR